MTELRTEEELYKKTPQELTLLLYKALGKNIQTAIENIEVKKYDTANDLLQKCNDILERLGAGLNYEAGIIADQLEVLYQYLSEQMIQANIKKDTEILTHCLEIIKSITDAWQMIIESGQPKEAKQLSKRLAYETVFETVQVDTKE